MSYTYTWTNNNQSILRRSDGAFIPTNPSNIDYQKYLKWVEEGNIALPPDPEPEPLTPEQKLEASGLTVQELKSLLGLE